MMVVYKTRIVGRFIIVIELAHFFIIHISAMILIAVDLPNFLILL